MLHAFTDGRDTLPTSAPEYLAQAEAWLAEASRRGRAGPGRVRDGPLLGDGPRPPLGPHEARLRRARARGGPARGRARRTPSSRRTAATRPTSSSSRRSSASRAPLRDGDSVHHVQLPPRPDAPDRARAGRAGLRRVRPPRLPARPPHDDDALPGGLGLSGRVRRRRGPRSRSPRCWPSAATASCTSPRPRSTPHVTYFFNGGEEHPYPGEERCLVPSPRDVATYDHKPEMSARSRGRARSSDRWRAAAAGGPAVPLRDHQFREPRHGRPHGQHPGRDARGRDGRPVPRRGARGGAGDAAAARS